MVRTITYIILFLFICILGNTQEPLKHEKKTYISPEGKLYIQKDLGLYLWMSTEAGESSKKYLLESEESKAYANPMYLDTDGYNTLRSPSAIDSETKKLIYPIQDIIFELYADEGLPITKIDFGETKPYTANGIVNLGDGTVISLAAKDALSGVEKILFSMDGEAYKPFTTPIKITAEKQYILKYYAVDNVGNAELVNTKTLVYDKTNPITKLTIEGDKSENIISARSKILLNAEDKGVGLKSTYYKIDEGKEKIYKTAILASYLSQDNHKISYYSLDKVGNKEAEHTYDFYVDKSAPTIIEEVMGKSFFSGGKEFSSGKSRLKLTSFDNKAGVKEIRYSVNGGEYKVYDKPVYLTQASGNLAIKSYAVDKVNNRSNSQVANEKTSIPYIDLSGPELSKYFKGPKFKTRDTLFINSNTKIILAGNDGEAGLNRIEYTVNKGDALEFESGINIDREGYIKIEFTGFDNVDNTSIKSFEVKVDNTGPVIKESFGTTPLRKADGLFVYPSHTVLFLTATDMIVGLHRITYALNGAAARETTGMLKSLPKGKNSITVKAYDKLNNSTELKLNFIIE